MPKEYSAIPSASNSKNGPLPTMHCVRVKDIVENGGGVVFKGAPVWGLDGAPVDNSTEKNRVPSKNFFLSESERKEFERWGKITRQFDDIEECHECVTCHQCKSVAQFWMDYGFVVHPGMLTAVETQTVLKYFMAYIQNEIVMTMAGMKMDFKQSDYLDRVKKSCEERDCRNLPLFNSLL